MAEVPNHLVPADGLTDADIRFSSLKVHDEGGADVYFSLYDDDENHLADFVIYVEPGEYGSIDRLVAEAQSGCATCCVSGSTQLTRCASATTNNRDR